MKLCTGSLTCDRGLVGTVPLHNSRPPAGSKRFKQHTNVPRKLTGSRTVQRRYGEPLPAVVDPGQLAAIAAEPVAEVAVLGGVGALCARQGLLPLQGRRFLSGLVMNVFTPALLFSKLGTSVDLSEAIRLWPLAVNMVACHVAGLGLGLLTVKTLRVPASLASQVMVMTAMGNIGNLPLVLIPALLSRPGVLELFLSSSDSNSSSSSSSSSIEFLSSVPAATGVGLEYVMLGFFYASFIQFPLGYLLLQRKPEPDQQQEGLSPQPMTAPAAAAAKVAAPGTQLLGSQADQTGQTGAVLAQSAAGLTAVATSSATKVLAQQPGQQISVQQVQPLPQQQQQVQMVLRGVFTPPVIACLLAVPVASIPALRAALFDPGGPLRSLGDVTSLLGAPLIPCLFLVLGANLAEGPGAAQVPSRVLAGLICSKLLLHPLLGLASILAALHAGLLPGDTDPLMVLVMLLVWCPPTAVLTHSLATMLQNGEDQVSYLLFWQYLASLVSLPVCLALYLQLLQSGLLAAAVV